MPMEFLTDAQVAGYGRFDGVPSRAELERFFFLAEHDRGTINRQPVPAPGAEETSSRAPDRWDTPIVRQAGEGLAGDVMLEAAAGLAVGLAFCSASFQVGAGGGVVAGSDEGDDVQCPVEPVADAGSGGCLDRRGPGEHREGGFGADPAGVDQAIRTSAATMGRRRAGAGGLVARLGPLR
jgi:hypothetical protein